MAPLRSDDADQLARAIVERVGPEIRLALPLGLGKPVTLVNALTRLVADDPSLHLTIFTALTLEPPEPSDPMARALMEPARERLFGAYPRIDYARWLHDGTLPDNIEVVEFFLMAGRWLGNAWMQQAYVSANYTHALDVLAERRPNLLAQLVAPLEDGLSLSCNTDISADLLEMRRNGAQDFVVAAELNPELPPMRGTARMPTDEAAFLLDPPEPFELFSAVRMPVSDAEHAIGLHVSRLVPDGGTLQIGIGSLGDAVAQALLLRSRVEIADIQAACPFATGERFAEDGPFETGLYAVTEMLVEGILQLYEAGVIRREVAGAAIHAGFFVETRDFYRRLREMPAERRDRIAMEPVSFTNSLYGDEAEKRAARQGARFVNTAMKATLLGAAVSDATEDGQVVSGVGGQFNFVEQAFALKDARSIIALPATRTRRGKTESNIVWSYGHVTVPRHMRDIVVTEYGIADLRGKSDAEVIAAMLEVADARFQPGLLKQAQAAGKIAKDYEIPAAARTNTPAALRGWIAPFRPRLPAFPFGTDFTDTEARLLRALSLLKEAGGAKRALAPYVLEGLRPASPEETEALARLELDASAGWKQRLRTLALRGALRKTRR
ncbi:acetyl-CoA hydrolase/transferase C-terminal domain-containing protein [Psychromarinibacter sp. C21-152]|uniref:Acetyl-CoA hydrolase/transferase C-terminal domain-containing protein n=1 Tax=Psychromarinibacter sediminicola TaxID=3033385 RepID=A0AAE3NVZ2_9RHOB|nr:acetyl-CoA hydrolase/transferase C-terminal domain-containing protein [Psychromarinibacter sediminicola]MDF0603031.1 acetyl-CoA hydrolase/transferase C-terminal domain-containing protein [Psychromarinibacter sediminicola]